MAAAEFLVEIGTEELPPRALRGLASAFATAIAAELDERRLVHGTVTMYATPRRLAVLVDDVADRQEDRSAELKGPPVSVAFADDGSPAPAARAFAEKAGVAVSDLERRATDKGEWLYATRQEEGAPLAALAAGLVSAALARLPVPRPMRWGSGEVEFVRPVHWVVMMHGGKKLPGEVLGVAAGNRSYGHRFHAPGGLTIPRAGSYAEMLEAEGRVVAGLDERAKRIREMVAAAAKKAGGTAVGGDELYDEVAALVEWPVPVTGHFEESFLALPTEVVAATLTSHQRYFPVAGKDGALLPVFITIVNIDSREPDRVRDGNERVVRPRLADAAFFWDTDRKTTLADRLPALDRVVYQKGLGSTGDKARRVGELAGHIAGSIGADEASARRAGLLSKCDLLSGMVGEFPELQGTMGAYYAREDGEPDAVAQALGEQYLPAFAGDAIPASEAGRSLALADRVDTLCGIFALGKRPSGNKDPFGLRRAALGIVRILIEGELDLDLPALLDRALAAQPLEVADDTAAAVYEFVVERLKAYTADEMEVTTEMFEAVRDRRPRSLLDFAERLRAVRSFVALEEASALAAANKRIGNILRQAEFGGGGVRSSLLADPSEEALYAELETARADVVPMLEARAYTEALARLAGLREPVDRFFDDVMVMVDDDKVRANRLGLLAALRDQFLGIADISRLAIR